MTADPMTTIPHDVDARTPVDLLRSSATVVWFCLILATLVSWAMGTHHGFIDSDEVTSVLVLLIAFVKVRFIGLYFMDLKDAPPRLRVFLEAWCAVVGAATIGVYLLG